MNWIEVTIETTTEGIEAVTACLIEQGITGMAIEDGKDLKNFLERDDKSWDYVDEELLKKQDEGARVTFYVSDNLHGQETLSGVRSAIMVLSQLSFDFDIGTLAIQALNVDDEDWLNNWKKYYKTFQVGEKVWIKPVWEQFDAPKDQVVFTIDPGHVFGTGLHQTTQLCITGLEKVVNSESTILDLGCGTGILSIISLLLGASNAVAVDLDPNAKETAYKNAVLNGINVDDYCVYDGNILENKEIQDTILASQYSVVVANIVADVIIGISPFVKKALAPKGHFISSGIITERTEDVKKALVEQGFDILGVYEKDGWISIVSTQQ